MIYPRSEKTYTAYEHSLPAGHLEAPLVLLKRE